MHVTIIPYQGNIPQYLLRAFTVGLNGVIAQATTALVAVTTREAERKGRLRIGVGTDKTKGFRKTHSP